MSGNRITIKPGSYKIVQFICIGFDRSFVQRKTELYKNGLNLYILLQEKSVGKKVQFF